MSALVVKATVVAGTLALVVIPALLHRGATETRVLKSHKGLTERIVLGLMSIGFLLPLVWVTSPALRFADYESHPVTFLTGLAAIATGLWLHYEAHATLGSSWSITLEVREGHELVTHGIYAKLRHPMYLALLLYSLGLALTLPNWVAGCTYLLAVMLLISLRLGPEERMMREEFGLAYEAYMRRTKRLLPGLW